jgi:hypothetical protein
MVFVPRAPIGCLRRTRLARSSVRSSRPPALTELSFQAYTRSQPLRFRQVGERRGTATFVWFCRDVQNNAYVWGVDGSRHLIAASDYLALKGPKTSDDYFRLVYPDVLLPERGAS